MAHPLTGTRIRDRRLERSIKQADLARTVGISPSYLNLIEHNRRRIGGRILNEIARALELDPAILSEGAPEGLITELEAVRATAGVATATAAESAADLAQRFPGWAQLLAAQARTLALLEAQVDVLSDRITHDPDLQASVHDVLSVVTSIRSSASILVGGDPLDRDWEQRFYRNIYEDSQRLAESSQALAHYLEAPTSGRAGLVGPWDQLNAWLDREGHHVAELEGGGSVEAFVEARGWSEGPVRDVGRQFAVRYRADALALPLDLVEQELDRHGPDPAALAHASGRPLVQVMRRLAGLPPSSASGLPLIGLAIADAAGTVTQLKTFPGFEFPASGPRCPLWPLFGALSQPSRPIRGVVSLPGPEAFRLSAYAIAEEEGPARFDGPPLLWSTMIVVADAPREQAAPVGRACRICSRPSCTARREPAIVTRPFDSPGNSDNS